MNAISLAYNQIERRALSHLEERVIPLLKYKINTKLDGIRRKLLKEFGYKKSKQIDDYITLCKTKLLLYMGEERLKEIMQKEIALSLHSIHYLIQSPSKSLPENLLSTPINLEMPLKEVPTVKTFFIE